MKVTFVDWTDQEYSFKFCLGVQNRRKESIGSIALHNDGFYHAMTLKPFEFHRYMTLEEAKQHFRNL